MNIERATEAMTRDLGPDPVVAFVTNLKGDTVAIAAGSPAVLDELREMGLITSVETPEMRKAS